MKRLTVKSIQGAYTVLVGRKLLSQAGRLIQKHGVFSCGIVRGRTKMLVVVQKNVFRHFGAALCRSLESAGLQVKVHLIPQGEQAKSAKELFRLYQRLLRESFDRSDGLLALGGGVTGDLCGFAASTYLRGIALVNVATTLLAQVDSSVGGKTGINLSEGKNLIGTFYPARLVLADADVLETLPDREFKASMAEVVKYGVIRDPVLFRKLEMNVEKILRRDKAVLAEVTGACIRIKARVVERDEKETRGERMILNYGHTFAHAFEKGLHYKGLRHGEAVAIGMTAAGLLSRHLGLWTETPARRQEALLQKLGLPVSLKKFSLRSRDLLQAMHHDKKKQSGRLRFVLPEKIGRVVVREGIHLKDVKKILKRIGGK